jgi:hypothetical protein
MVHHSEGHQAVLTMRYILIALTLALLGVGVVGAQSQDLPTAPAKAEQKPQAGAKHKQQHPSTDLDGTESAPLFVKVTPHLPIEPRPAEHDYSSSEWWLVYITGFLVVVTAVLAGYTAKLWGSTKSLAEDAKRTADRQASDMQESLSIAKESAQAAKATADALINSERAWVAVARVQMSPRKFEIGRRYSISINMVNHGRTVARLRAYFHGRCHTIKHLDDLPPVPDYPTTHAMPGAQHTTIFLKPNETMQSAEIPLDPIQPTAEQLADINEGRLRVVFDGRFTYFDFADQERITQFCYVYVALSESWEIAGPREYNKNT